MTLTLYMHLPTYEPSPNGGSPTFCTYMDVEVETAYTSSIDEAAEKIVEWKIAYNLYDKRNWWIGEHRTSRHE